MNATWGPRLPVCPTAALPEAVMHAPWRSQCSARWSEGRRGRARQTPPTQYPMPRLSPTPLPPGRWQCRNGDAGTLAHAPQHMYVCCRCCTGTGQRAVAQQQCRHATAVQAAHAAMPRCATPLGLRTGQRWFPPPASPPTLPPGMPCSLLGTYGPPPPGTHAAQCPHAPWWHHPSHFFDSPSSSSAAGTS